MIKKPRNLFEKIIFEAPDDPPPDLGEIDSTTDPPDIPEISQEDTMGMDSEAPPNLNDEDTDGLENYDDNNVDQDNAEDEMELDEKISAIMNQNLYQRFLALLNNLGSQLTQIKNHSDALYTLSNDSLDIIGSLKKLDENVRLYLDNTFLTENYSKNLLFFNKCLNLLKLLNDIFEKNIRKGIDKEE